MKDIAQDIAEEVPSLIRREQYFYFRRIFDNTADRNKGIKDSRMWIFDVDDQEHVELLMKYLIDNGMQGDPWCGIIPTLNGAHFLMKPHDVRYMSKTNVTDELTLKDIADVKKSALTVCYFNDEWEKDIPMMYFNVGEPEEIEVVVAHKKQQPPTTAEAMAVLSALQSIPNDDNLPNFINEDK